MEKQYLKEISRHASYTEAKQEKERLSGSKQPGEWYEIKTYDF